jgi:quercetin dioxygenase-like cupin family protein
MAEHLQVGVAEVDPAPVRREDGWRKMDIRFMITTDNAPGTRVCWWRTVFPPGAAHERHFHPAADEVLFVLRGRGAAGTDSDEREIRPGEAQFIPAGATHWLRNLDTEAELEIVGCYSPAGSLEEAGYEYVGDITDEYKRVR